MRVLAFPPLPPTLRAVLLQMEQAREALLLVPPNGASLAAASAQVADVVLAPAESAAAELDPLAPRTGMPLVVVWGDAEACVAALAAGADVWIDPVETAPQLRARLAALLRRARRESPAGRDAGTGLLGSALFAALLRREFERAARYRRPLAMVALSSDHPAGDAEEPRRLADGLRGMVRDCDTLAFLGEGRFALLLPETDAGGAMAAAARLRVVAATPGADASAGIASFPTRGIAGPDDLLGRCLEALAHARRRGGQLLAFGAADVAWAPETPPTALF